MFLQIFPSGPIETNAIFVACEKTKSAAIFDPALGSLTSLFETATELGYTIEVIYLTHGHWDHIGDLAELKREKQLPFFMHPADADVVIDPPKIGRFAIEGAVPDGYLEEGQTFQLGTLECRVIHTPGHTPGGICFYFPKEGVLISGDTLFRGTMGRVDLPGASPTQMWMSLKKLSLLPPETRVIPGHGEETTLKKESWISNPEKFFNER